MKAFLSGRLACRTFSSCVRMCTDSMSEESTDKAMHAVVGRLYVEHHAWLTKWLRLRLGNAHEAADLAQDTFERLLRFRVQSPIQEPRAYLTVMAQRLMIGRARRRALEQAYAEALSQAPQRYEASPEQHLLVMQTLEELCEMLDGLSRQSRQVFILAQVQGMSHEEVGLHLGMTRNAVQKSLSRALAHCYAVVYG